MAYVCLCHGINEETVNSAIRDGATTIDEVVERCEAGAGCGGCHPTIETLITIAGDLAGNQGRSPAA